MVAINSVAKPYAIFNAEFISLNMEELTKSLDCVDDNDESQRLMPSANSYKWTEEFVAIMEEKSMHIFDDPNATFRTIFENIDVALVGEAANNAE